jgi:hypothetical protein
MADLVDILDDAYGINFAGDVIVAASSSAPGVGPWFVMKLEMASGRKIDAAYLADDNKYESLGFDDHGSGIESLIGLPLLSVSVDDAIFSEENGGYSSQMDLTITAEGGGFSGKFKSFGKERNCFSLGFMITAEAGATDAFKANPVDDKIKFMMQIQ